MYKSVLAKQQRFAYISLVWKPDEVKRTNSEQKKEIVKRLHAISMSDYIYMYIYIDRYICVCVKKIGRSKERNRYFKINRYTKRFVFSKISDESNKLETYIDVRMK